MVVLKEFKCCSSSKKNGEKREKVWSFGAVYESFEDHLRKKCYFYIETVDRCNKESYNNIGKFDIELKFKERHGVL